MRRPFAQLVVGLSAVIVSLMGVAPRAAGELDARQRQFLRGSATLSPASIESINAAADPDALREQIAEILALDNLSVGSRRTVDPRTGASAIHRYIRGRIDATPGVELIGVLKDRSAFPVTRDNLITRPAGEPPTLTAKGRRFDVAPLWPNGVMPALTPAKGLTGPLVAVGRADWPDLAGKDLRGAIALMDFGGGRNWERLFELGAAGVVVIEDDFVNREKAERLFSTTPVPFARFYVPREVGRELHALAADGAQATLRGGQVYEQRPLRSIFAYLPPTDPQTYTVAPDDLLNRLARQHATTVAELRRLNPGFDHDAGGTLILPGRATQPLSLGPDALLRRIADQFGIKRSELLAANPRLLEQTAEANDLAPPAVLERIDRGEAINAPLNPGDTLSIPNLNESVVIQVMLDGVSVVPDAPHGFKTATNLAAALSLMDLLAAPETVRRRGVVFAFLDGEAQGGLASRKIAEQALAFGRPKPTEFSWLFMIVVFSLVVGLGVLTTWMLTGRGIEEKAARRRRRKKVALIAAGPYIATGLFFGYLPQVFAAATARAQVTEQAPAAWYQQALAVWAGDEQNTTLSDEFGRWFVADWLFSRVEAARNQVFERRVRLQARARAMADDSPEAEAAKQRLEARVEELRPQSGQIGAIRSDTIDQTDPTWVHRARALRDRLREEGQTWAHLGLTAEAFETRLRQEMAEQRAYETMQAENQRLLAALRDRLHPEDPSARTPVLGFFLDLSDGSASLGFTHQGNAGPLFRERPPYGGTAVLDQARRWRQVIDAAQREAGWSAPWSFLTPDDEAVHPIVHFASPSYAEFWKPLGVAVLPIGTYNDPRDTLDTPADVLDPSRRLDHVGAQVRTLATLMRLTLERPSDARPPAKLPPQPFGQLLGRIVRFNARSGVNAKEPVPGSLVYYPAQRRQNNEGTHNPGAFLGTRRAVVRIARLSGSYTMPVEHERFVTRSGNRGVHVYRLDEQAAAFDAVVNEGMIGTQRQSRQFTLRDGMVTEKNLVMTRVYPRVFFPGPDPMDYDPIGEPGQNLEVIDAVIEGEPQHFALDNPFATFSEGELSANVLYLRPDRHARVRVRSGATYKLLLTGPIDPEHPKGAGYRVGPVLAPDGAVIDRNLTIARTDAAVAGDMLAAAQRLYGVMRDKGVRDQAVLEALDDAQARLETAEALAEDRQWRGALGEARQAWGTLVKFYPRLLKLGREAVFSAVFLMIMLLPASFFLERLIIGGKGVIARLTGAVIIFGLLTAYLNLVHPAFRISVSPFIVIVAFAMILMSSVVLLICYQRFDVLMKRAKAEAGEVEGESISLASSLGTALSLGVSNLRKRPSRTFLTALTVTVLTFSIITFVSVSGRDAFLTRQLEIDRESGNRVVEPYAPRYEGVVFRDFFHVGLSSVFINALRSEFGRDNEVAVRGWYIQMEGGNNVNREGINQERVRAADGAFAEVTGVMTFEPAERRLSRLHEAVSNRQWFAPGDRSVIILPDNVAEALSIDPGMLYEGTAEQIASGEASLKPAEDLPRVFVRNRWWSVIGILDTAEADRFRDVTGKSLAMVDYLKSGLTSSVGGGGDLLDEPPGYHLPWRELVIVPHRAAGDVGAKPRCVAIGFKDEDAASRFYERALLRLNKPIFGSGVAAATNTPPPPEHPAPPPESAPPPPEDAAAQTTGGAEADARPVALSLLTTRSATDLAGVAKVIVPVILCVLIVLNTMLGNVEERKGEVNMLGAVGLSPGQIAFLLLSESAVFSVLGIVIGLLVGLGFGYVVSIVNPTNDPQGFMGGLNLNFASLSSVGLAMLSGLVVLLATIIPARKAARLAAPSGMGRWQLPEADDDGAIRFTLPFTLTRGNAIGMGAFFRQFLTNHTDPAADAFNCRDIHLRIATDPDRLELGARMWLAPYDLDVAQAMTLSIVPTDDRRVFAVIITLRRSSGSQEAWVRTNYGFLDLVRRQFLLWRHLKPAQRQRYIERGKTLIREAMETNI